MVRSLLFFRSIGFFQSGGDTRRQEVLQSAQKCGVGGRNLPLGFFFAPVPVDIKGPLTGLSSERFIGHGRHSRRERPMLKIRSAMGNLVRGA